MVPFEAFPLKKNCVSADNANPDILTQEYTGSHKTDGAQNVYFLRCSIGISENNPLSQFQFLLLRNMRGDSP